MARFAHYPNPQTFPTGARGAGGLFANASFNLTGPEYLHHPNDLVTIIVQIESPSGVANSANIAAIDRTDALFLGPNDLASSMGFFAFDHPKTPEVQAAITKVLEAAKSKGKFAGHFALVAEEATKIIKQGFHFLNCGADIIAISAWMSEEMSRMKKRLM